MSTQLTQDRGGSYMSVLKTTVGIMSYCIAMLKDNVVDFYVLNHE